MNYYVITETNWAKLRDEILSLAECCHKAFGEKSKHTDWLHNGDVCRLLNISKRTLQHYRDTGVLPFTQIGHKCYYKREDVESLLLSKTNNSKNRQITQVRDKFNMKIVLTALILLHILAAPLAYSHKSNMP